MKQHSATLSRSLLRTLFAPTRIFVVANICMLVTLSACGGDGNTAQDAGTPDGTTPDAQPSDAQPSDGQANDAQLPDAQLVEIAVGLDPRFIVAGSDDDLWFTECKGNKIGRITTKGQLTEFPVPTADSCPLGIARSTLKLGDGGVSEAFFFTERTANKIGAVTPAGEFFEFPIPSANTCPYGITAWPTDSRLWFTEFCNPVQSTPDKIGSLDPSANPSIVEVKLQSGGANLSGIAAGPDGFVWFAELSPSQGRVGRYRPTGGGSECTVPVWESEPIMVAAGPDGKMWFTEYAGNAIGVADPAAFVCPQKPFTEFPIPTVKSNPVGIAAGPPCSGATRAVWFAEEHGNRVACITTTGSVTEYPVSSSAFGITEGPDGNVWFTEPTANKVGRLKAP
jgi:virginiamycin B lyase